VARVATAVSIVALLALVAAAVQWRQADDARARTNLTEAAYRWMALARDPVADPRQGVLGALEAANAYATTIFRSLPNDLVQGLWEEHYAARRARHAVTFFSLSPDGELVARAGLDGVVRIVGVDDRLTRAEIPLGDALRNVEFSPAGDVLATVTTRGDEAVVTLWRIPPDGGEPKPTELPPALANVDDTYLLLFDPAGRTIGLTDGATSFTIWDVASRTLQETRRGERAGLGAIGPNRELATRDVVGNLTIEGPRSAELPPRDGLTDRYTGPMAFSIDGRSFAAATASSIQIWNDGSQVPVEVPVDSEPAVLGFAADDGALHWLDGICNTGRVDPSAADPAATKSDTTLGCFGYPAGLFDADAKRVATLTDDGLAVWATEAEDYELALFDTDASPLSGEAVVAPDGTNAILDDGVVLVHDADGTLRWKVEASAIALSGDGRRLATYDVAEGGGRVRLYDLASGEELASTGTVVEAYSLAVDDRGGRIALVAYDNSVTVWDVGSGDLSFVPPSSVPDRVLVQVAVVHPRSPLVALGLTDGSVVVVDTESGEATASLKAAASGWVAAVDYDDSGNSLAIGDSAGRVLTWSGRNGDDPVEIGTAGGIVHTLESSGNAIAVGTTAQTLRSGGQGPATVTVWSATSSNRLARVTIYGEDVFDVAVDHGADRVATVEADGFTHVLAWDATGADALDAARALADDYRWDELTEADCVRLVDSECPLRD
jgi:WD40 repeat protein